MPPPAKITVVGLGYVGLPLAVALARHYPTVGFDVDAARVADLKAGRDRTGEISSGDLAASALEMSADPPVISGSEVFIVAVPTPVDGNNEPDLGALRSACAIVGPRLATGATVVFESTVYPGVTEDICGPALAAASGLECGREFFLGYSPERINPGDRDHTVERIRKVVAGQNGEVTSMLAEIYGSVTKGGVFRAASIRTAEAAKVIENAQRDINIAFINEVAMIFDKLDLSVSDVLAAARTKWNFLDFRPGLVGGHCIGVDPYYLAFGAQQIGHDPEIVLAGRRINDSMGAYVAGRIADGVRGGGRVLVLGLTFKENVPDLRNTKVVDVVSGLTERGLTVDVHDGHADAGDAAQFYGLDLVPDTAAGAPYDCLVGAVAHDEYCAYGAEDLRALLAEDGLLADIKGIWREIDLPGSARRWQL